MVYIATVTFNDIHNLKRTIGSVRKFKKSYQRYVVVDGASSDGTVEFCQLNADIIDYFISESDQGIYDAMNKVLNVPNIKDDDYIIWINGGDELLDWDDEIYESLQSYDCAFYNVYLGIEGKTRCRLPRIEIRTPYNEKNFSPSSTFFHQGFFIRVGAFRKWRYDIGVGVQAENLLMSQAIQNLHYFVSQKPVAKFYLGGISSHFWPLFKSWLLVAARLDFSFVRLLVYQRGFIIRQFVKLCIPEEWVYRHFLAKQERLFNIENSQI